MNPFYTHISFSYYPYSAGGIATGYGLDDQGVEVRVSVGDKFFPSPRRGDLLWNPPNLLLMGTGGSFTEDKAVGA
jgi:hypothetical protein